MATQHKSPSCYDNPKTSLVPTCSHQQSQSSQEQLNRVLGNIDPETLMLGNGAFYEEVERQRHSMRYYRYFFLIFWIITLLLLGTFIILAVTNRIDFSYSLGSARKQIVGGTSF